jgi:hypothetical protein
MNDQETIARFIFLRSQGWSFNRIAVELQLSKPTLIKWGRQHQFEIANLRATETEALAERVFRSFSWVGTPAPCANVIAPKNSRNKANWPGPGRHCPKVKTFARLAEHFTNVRCRECDHFSANLHAETLNSSLLCRKFICLLNPNSLCPIRSS